MTLTLPHPFHLSALASPSATRTDTPLARTGSLLPRLPPSSLLRNRTLLLTYRHNLLTGTRPRHRLEGHDQLRPIADKVGMAERHESDRCRVGLDLSLRGQGKE
jgi:hypothetical protein